MRGTRLAGRYEVVEELGSGGFGKTYVAKDTLRPGSPECVVKHLAPSNANTQVIELARRLFQTEAETLERIGRHERIPTLLAFFDEGGEFFLVEEFIKGHRLNEELGHRQRMPERRVVTIVCELLNILVFIHGQGVIHRDIKPSNVIRAHDSGRLYLIDFGAVKDVGEQITRLESEEVDKTVGIGSQGYAAPEQLAGHPRFASDVYAVGVIGIQALTGQYPFELPSDPNTTDLVWRDAAEVSPEVADVLDGMTRLSIADRYSNAAEPLSVLMDWLPAEMREAVFADTTSRNFASSVPVIVSKAPPLTDADRTGPTRAIPVVKRVEDTADAPQEQEAAPQEVASGTRSAMSLQDAPPGSRKKNMWLLGVLAAGMIFAGAGGWALVRSVMKTGEPGAAPVGSASTAVEAPGCRHDHVSYGGRILSAAAASKEKEKGAKQFAAGRFSSAKESFDKAAWEHHDPEAAIYALNASLSNEDHPTVAAVVPYSASTQRAEELLRGVARAQRLGRSGVKVRVAVVDDGNDPELAKVLAACLAKDPTVLGVVGHGTSGTTLAAAPTYGEVGLVVVSPISSAVELSDAGDHMFRTMPSDNHAARALARHLSKLGKRKVAVFLAEDDTYSLSFAKEFRDALFYSSDDAEIVAKYDLSGPSFASSKHVKRAKDIGAEALVIAGGSSSLDRAIQAVLANDGDLPVVAGDGMYSPKLLELCGEAAEGMVLAVPSAVMADPKWKAEEDNGRVTWRTLLSFDATEALLQGLKEDPSRVGLRRELSSPGFKLDGAGGRVEFKRNGDLKGGVALVEVRVNDGGGAIEFASLRTK